MTTVIIKDGDGQELSITREANNLEEMLELWEDALRALGFQFNGKITIEDL